MNLRTASLATVLLAAAVSLLPASANAQRRGGWGWGGFGVGLAAGAIIGGALAAPYYSYGYAPGYSYGYGYATATRRVTATATHRVTATATHRLTATATPVAFMPMLRIGNTGGGTTVDESERSNSLAIFRARSDRLEEDRRRGTFTHVLAHSSPSSGTTVPLAQSVRLAYSAPRQSRAASAPRLA